jgi:hypothetical protein
VLPKHVAASDGDGFPDGVVFANAGGRQVEDLLQWLFTLFWDTGEVVWTPGPLRIGGYLRDVRARVVLDDVGLGSSDVERLLRVVRLTWLSPEQEVTGSNPVGRVDKRPTNAGLLRSDRQA